MIFKVIKTSLLFGFMFWVNIKSYTARSISSKIASALRKCSSLVLHQDTRSKALTSGISKAPSRSSLYFTLVSKHFMNFWIHSSCTVTPEIFMVFEVRAANNHWWLVTSSYFFVSPAICPYIYCYTSHIVCKSTLFKIAFKVSTWHFYNGKNMRNIIYCWKHLFKYFNRCSHQNTLYPLATFIASSLVSFSTYCFQNMC